ncbi:MAG TPA: SAM-dependent methyltransferase [Streptosporangiaceae bacterium]|jgi:SAM-dependent methyltransferase|nr:SAM-dependent methyltransferase [Streptosporangiaceae bacterium]
MRLDPGYFDRMYARSPDPWGLRSRWYEGRKYALTMAMLPREQYADAFEPGCSVGVLTAMLAKRCDRLLACDVAAAAVNAAAERTAALPGVLVEQRSLPDGWPGGEFDLIVFSELLYYFAGHDLDRVVELAALALRPGGTLLAVHWRHPVADYPSTGDEVHEVLAARGGLALLVQHREPDFLAEAYIRTHGQPQSVAQAGGLV